MAIYHLSVKNISRRHGRSAVACAAYRAAERIRDERRGAFADYRRKQGVVLSEIILPDGAPAWARDRATLWNAAELKEKRKDARLAKEIVVALPHELSEAERIALARAFAETLAARGLIADLNVHRPHRTGDERNHHAHIMLTTRSIGADGFGKKLRGLDERAFIHEVRALWADLTNTFLAEGGHDIRVDHRSLEAQGIERTPQIKEGPKVRMMQRRKRPPPRSQIRRVHRSRGSRERVVDYRRIDRGRSRAERNAEIRALNRRRDQKRPSWQRRSRAGAFPYMDRDRVRGREPRER